MNIEQQDGINEISQHGRDFLEIRKSIDSGDVRILIKAMREGDYINMSGRDFRKWISFIPASEESLRKLDELEKIEVEIKEIIKAEEGDYNGTQLLVEGGGVCKKVYASLFFNYGICRVDNDIITTVGGSGFNNDPNQRGDSGVG